MLDQNNRELEFYFTSNCIVSDDFYESKGDEFKTITIGDLDSTHVTLYETWSPDTLFINNKERKYYQRKLSEVVNMILSYNSKANNKFQPTLVFKTITNKSYYIVVDDFYLYDANESYDDNEWNAQQKNMTLKLLCRKNSFNIFSKNNNYSSEMPNQPYASVNFNMSGFTYREIDFNDNSVFLNNKVTNNFNVNKKTNIFENINYSKGVNAAKPNFNFTINRECLVNNDDEVELYLSFTYNCENPLKIVEYQDWSKSTSSISHNRRIIKTISPDEFVSRIEALNSYLSINIDKDKTNFPLKFLWFRPTVYIEVQGQKVLAVINSFDVKSLNSGSQVLNLIINKNFMKNENNETVDYSNINSGLSNVYLNIDSVSDPENVSPDNTISFLSSFGLNIMTYKNPAQGLSHLGLLNDINKKFEGERDISSIYTYKPHESSRYIAEFTGSHVFFSYVRYQASTINSKYYTKYDKGTDGKFLKNHKKGNLYILNTRGAYNPNYIEFELINETEGFEPQINVYNTNSLESVTVDFYNKEFYQTINQEYKYTSRPFRLSGYNTYRIEVTSKTHDGDYILIVRDCANVNRSTWYSNSYIGKIAPGLPYSGNFYATPQNKTYFISETPGLVQGYADMGVLNAGADQRDLRTGLPTKRYIITLTQNRMVNIELTGTIKDGMIVITPIDSLNEPQYDKSVSTTSQPKFYRHILAGDARGKKYMIEITPVLNDVTLERWDINENTVGGNCGNEGFSCDIDDYYRETYNFLMYLSDSDLPNSGNEPANLQFSRLAKKTPLEIKPKLTLESKEQSEIILQKPKRFKESLQKRLLTRNESTDGLETFFVDIVDDEDDGTEDILFSTSQSTDSNLSNEITIKEGKSYKFDLSSRTLLGNNFQLRTIVDDPTTVITTTKVGVPGLPGSYISYTPPLIYPPDQTNPSEIFLVETTTDSFTPGKITVFKPEENVNPIDVHDYQISLNAAGDGFRVFDVAGQIFLDSPINVYQGWQYTFRINNEDLNGMYIEFQSTDDVNQYAEVERVGVPGEFNAYINVLFPVRNLTPGGGQQYQIVASGDNSISPFLIQSLDPFAVNDIVNPDPPPPEIDAEGMPWWGSLITAVGLFAIGLIAKEMFKRYRARNGEHNLENFRPLDEAPANGLGGERTTTSNPLYEPLDRGEMAEILRKTGTATGDLEYKLNSEEFNRATRMLSETMGRYTNEFMTDLLTQVVFNDGEELMEAFGDLFNVNIEPFDANQPSKLQEKFTDGQGNQLEFDNLPTKQFDTIIPEGATGLEVTIVKNLEEFEQVYGKTEADGGILENPTVDGGASQSLSEFYKNQVEIVDLQQPHVIELDFSDVGAPRTLKLINAEASYAPEQLANMKPEEVAARYLRRLKNKRDVKLLSDIVYYDTVPRPGGEHPEINLKIRSAEGESWVTAAETNRRYDFSSSNYQNVESGPRQFRRIDFRNVNVRGEAPFEGVGPEPVIYSTVGNYAIRVDKGVTEPRGRGGGKRINTGLIRVKPSAATRERYFLIASEHAHGADEVAGAGTTKARSTGALDNGQLRPEQIVYSSEVGGGRALARTADAEVKDAARIDTYANFNPIGDAPRRSKFSEQVQKVMTIVGDMNKNLNEYEMNEFTKDAVNKLFDDAKLDDYVTSLLNDMVATAKQSMGIDLQDTPELREEIKTELRKAKADILSTILDTHTNTNIMKNIFKKRMAEFTIDTIKRNGEIDLAKMQPLSNAEFKANPPYIRNNKLYEEGSDVAELLRPFGRGSKGEVFTTKEALQLARETYPGPNGGGLLAEVRGKRTLDPADFFLDRLAVELGFADYVKDIPGLVEGTYGEFLGKAGYNYYYDYGNRPDLDVGIRFPAKIENFPDAFVYKNISNPQQLEAVQKIENLRSQMRSNFDGKPLSWEVEVERYPAAGDGGPARDPEVKTEKRYSYRRDLPEKTTFKYSDLEQAFGRTKLDQKLTELKPAMEERFADTFRSKIAEPKIYYNLTENVINSLGSYTVNVERLDGAADLLRLGNAESINRLVDDLTAEFFNENLYDEGGSSKIKFEDKPDIEPSDWMEAKEMEGGIRDQVAEIVRTAITEIQEEMLAGETQSDFFRKVQATADSYSSSITNRTETAIKEVFSREVNRRIYRLVGDNFYKENSMLRRYSNVEFQNYATGFYGPEPTFSFDGSGGGQRAAVEDLITRFSYASGRREIETNYRDPGPNSQLELGPEPLSDADFEAKYNITKEQYAEMKPYLEETLTMDGLIGNAVNDNGLLNKIYSGLQNIAEDVQELRNVEYVQGTVSDLTKSEEFEEIRDILTNKETYNMEEWRAEVKIIQALEEAALDSLDSYITNGGINEAMGEVSSLNPRDVIGNTNLSYDQAYEKAVLDKVADEIVARMETELPNKMANIESVVMASAPPPEVKAELRNLGSDFMRDGSRTRTEVRRRVRRRFRFI